MEKFYILDVNNENKSTIISLIEQEKDNFTSPEKIDEFKLLKDKSYGRARFLILVKS